MMALFRADASTAIGGGHVGRCLALAGALLHRGFDCCFVCREGTREVVPALDSWVSRLLILPASRPDNAGREILPHVGPGDLVVIDHYGLGYEYEKDCAKSGARILTIEDRPSRQHHCDYLLDQTYGRRAEEYDTLVPVSCTCLTGTRYALLKPEFARHRDEALRRHFSAGPARRLLIAPGATNLGNAVAPILRAVANCGLQVETDVALSSAALHLPELEQALAKLPGGGRLHLDCDDMASLMTAADLAVGAAGTSAWERCCLGLPSAVLVLADNQRDIAEALAGAGAALLLGAPGALPIDELAVQIGRLARDQGLRIDMAKRAAQLCDGRGADRVAAIVAGQ